jgi:ribose transport system ATP-binding protein
LNNQFRGSPLIKNFSLEINSGEVMCLLGNNGAGKTTLINLLTGLIPLEGGNVYLNLQDGKTISLKESFKEFRKYIRLCQ